MVVALPVTVTACAIGNVELGIGCLITSASAAVAMADSAAPSTRPTNFITFSPKVRLAAGVLDVPGRHRVLKVVAKVGPQIVHNGGDLTIGHHVAEWRHAVAAVDDEEHRIAAGFEILVAGERGVAAGADRPGRVRHVAALADIGE